MQHDVKKFVENCRICQHAKGRRQNIGLYQPIPIPTRTWDYINIDFVLGFPRTQRGNDSIYVVVDRFSKMAHFISCKRTNDATNIANLFFLEIVKLPGLPLSIVFDMDTKFVGIFGELYGRNWVLSLNFSSAYRPHIDG